MDDPSVRRHEQLAHRRMQLSTRYGDGFDKNIRPVARPDRDPDLGTLSLHLHEPRTWIHTPLGSHEQQHGAAAAVGVEHQPGHLPGLVLAAIGGQFQVVETKVLAVELGTTHHEQVGSFDPTTVGIFDLAGNPVLPRIGGQQLDRSTALGVGPLVPAANRLFFRLALLVIADPIKHKASLARHRATVERAGLGTAANRLASPIEAAIHPGRHSKRLPSSHHRTGADNRPPRSIHHLGRDPVSMIGVGMESLGQRRVDLQLDRPVLAKLHLVLHHQLRWLMRPAEPHRHRASTAPHPPARIPVVLGRKPPVTRSVQPVPPPRGVPVVRMRLAQHTHADLRPDNRSAEIVLGPNRGCDCFAQRHRPIRSLDRHLVLRLLVLLDPKRPATTGHPLVDPKRQLGLVTNNLDTVIAQVGVAGQLHFAIETTKVVGGELADGHFLVPWVGDSDRHLSPGKYADVVLVVTSLPDPELELHTLARPVDRPVGDRIHASPLEDSRHVSTGPRRTEPHIGTSAIGRPSDHQPA